MQIVFFSREYVLHSTGKEEKRCEGPLLGKESNIPTVVVGLVCRHQSKVELTRN